MTPEAINMKEVMGRAIELIIRVYRDAVEEFVEEGEAAEYDGCDNDNDGDGIALEDVCISDELYAEIVDFVENDLRAFVGELINERDYDEAIS